jgi:hypothetical protein
VTRSARDQPRVVFDRLLWRQQFAAFTSLVLLASTWTLSQSVSGHKMEGDAMEIAVPHPFEGDAVTPHPENDEQVVEDHALTVEVASTEQLMAVDSEETEQDRAGTSSGEDEEPGAVTTTDIENAVIVVDDDVEEATISVEVDKNLNTAAVIAEESRFPPTAIISVEVDKNPNPAAVVAEESGFPPKAVDKPSDPVDTFGYNYSDSGWGEAVFGTSSSSAAVAETPQESAAKDTSSGVTNDPFSGGWGEPPKDSGWGRKDTNRTNRGEKSVSWDSNSWGKNPSKSFERSERTDNWGMNPERAGRMYQRDGGSELLPPLGRASPQKIAQRAARRAVAAPYNYGARDRDNMRDQSSPEHLDYGSNEDPTPQPFNGNQKEAPKLDLVSRFRMMDMSSFGTEVMSHMKCVLFPYLCLHTNLLTGF